MRTSRLFSVGALFLSFAWVLAGGCSASNSPSPGDAPGGPTGGSGGGSQGDPTKLTPDASTVDGGMVDDLNALCGPSAEAGSCVPDNPNACRGYTPPDLGVGGESSSGGADAGGAATGGAGAATGSAGAPSGGAGTPTGGAATGGEDGINGGAPGQGGASGGDTASGGTPAGAGGESGSGPGAPAGLAAYSCQVSREGNQLLRQCAAAGTGIANAPCFSAADCAPSYACVTENDAGRCLPYCCAQNSTCTSGTFCAERPLRRDAADTSNAEPPHVPVCVPADACSLEDEYPCPSGSECRCKGDTACMVVRSPGTTTCMKPGTGQQGDACPCAWNHVCSSVTHQCTKICHTDPTSNDCGNQKCQASSELPQNFGLCVGPLK